MKKAVSVSLADLNSAVAERSAGRLQAMIMLERVRLNGVAPCVRHRSISHFCQPFYRADALTTRQARSCSRG